MRKSSVIVFLIVLGLAASAGANNGIAVRCDFDGNGFDDLAVGVPSEGIGGRAAAGSVNVMYSYSGLSVSNDAIFYQGSNGMKGLSEEGDAFGASLACGDFNGDGWDDLAVGVPQEDVGSAVNAGAVSVIYGTPFGLHSSIIEDQVWHQNVFGSDPAETGDRLGTSLVTGYFDADAYADLAIGIPGEDDAGGRNSGAVAILYGHANGLRSNGADFFDQQTPGIAGASETGDHFGEVLASGDFDGDGLDDLAIGVPLEDVSGLEDGGAVTVLYATNSGLAAAGSYLFHRENVLGTPGLRNQFGAALATADFNGDGYVDLAVGVPGATVNGFALAGEVNVVFGSDSGLTPWANELWTQNSSGIAGVAEEGDRFGATLAAGHFNYDSYADLAVGVPGEAVGALLGAGSINVLRGTSAGLDRAGNYSKHQDSPNVAGASEAGDAFASTLAVGDFNGDGRDDLAIGVPGEAVGSITAAGAIQVIHASIFGVGSNNDLVWHQNTTHIEGTAEIGDRLSGRNISAGVYRIGYVNGTTVKIGNDQYGHELRIDMSAQGTGPFTLAAAADGIVRAVVDNNAEPTSSNNYVWIEHPNGEWSKYSHMETGSVPAAVVVGASISAGDPIGTESDVGVAQGDHLHFNIAVPDDPANPINSSGFVIGDYRIPHICRIPGGVYVRDEVYTAEDC